MSLLAIIVKHGIPISDMSSVVLSIIAVSMNKIALWIRVNADDWTANFLLKFWEQLIPKLVIVVLGVHYEPLNSN